MVGAAVVGAALAMRSVDVVVARRGPDGLELHPAIRTARDAANVAAANGVERCGGTRFPETAPRTGGTGRDALGRQPGAELAPGRHPAPAGALPSSPMTAALTKESIDLGIVTKDRARSVAFYRDLVGLPEEGESKMPGGRMTRLLCGTTVIKLVELDRAPGVDAPTGGVGGATGYRYFTISVSNLDELVDKLAAAGQKVAVPVTQLGPGVRIAMVEDPDGNWVEFLERAG